MEPETESNVLAQAPVPLASDLNHSEAVSYRMVPSADIPILAPLFERLGWEPPDPEFSRVIVAQAGEGNNAIVLGFAVIQMICHAEPMWVHPSCRGTGIAEALAEQAKHFIVEDSKLKRFVCVAKPGSLAARLCERNGMWATPGQLYLWKAR